jgi:hypothetical protein
VQRLYVALHGTLGSSLRDVLQEGNAEAVACLHIPWLMRKFLLLVKSRTGHRIPRMIPTIARWLK